MTNNQQPEALRLAWALKNDIAVTWGDVDKAADELRRLHEITQEMISVLENVHMAMQLPGGHCEFEQLEPQVLSILEKVTSLAKVKEQA